MPTDPELIKKLAGDQGRAYDAALKTLLAEDPHMQSRTDDFIITASFEPAEGLYTLRTDGTLAWEEPPPGANQHLEVVAQDRQDKRFVPGLDVSMKIFDVSHRFVGEKKLVYLWHPFVYHYGADATIPDEGDYNIEVAVAKARFPRHDELRGKRYQQNLTISMGRIHLTPGRKPSGPE